MPEFEGRDQVPGLKVTDLVRRDEQVVAAFVSNIGHYYIDAIVEMAVQSYGAAAASIALVDSEENNLFFTAAYGAGKDEVIGKTIPSDVGIAGYVIMSGEPLSIEDVHEDSRFHHSFAESTGYIPSSILAAPITWAGEIIGVVEVLDIKATDRSQVAHLDLLNLFASIASSVIVQWQYSRLSGEFVEKK